MTTLTQLKKLASNSMTPFLKENGFKQVNTFDYIKEGPEGITYVIFAKLSYGGNLKVSAVCYTEEMQPLLSKKFPKSIPEMVGGRLKPDTPICIENRHIWKVDNENMSIAALADIEKNIKEFVIPFFESISTRQKLVDFIYPSMLEGEYKIIADNILSAKE